MEIPAKGLSNLSDVSDVPFFSPYVIFNEQRDHLDPLPKGSKYVNTLEEVVGSLYPTPSIALPYRTEQHRAGPDLLLKEHVAEIFHSAPN